jgi:hypothetical protein
VSKSELRHFCRNPLCRSKLKAPVANHREAFCARGCHTSFYRKRCLVCEREMPRNSGSQRTCYRADCKTAWRQKTVVSHFLGPSSTPVELIPETPIKHGVSKADKCGRTWQVIAGEISPNTFHCAAVSDGPNCRWKGGEYERVEAKNRAALIAADEAAIEANGYFTDPDWRAVVSPDGVKCFVTSFAAPARRALALPQPLTADLSIPDFLKRT